MSLLEKLVNQPAAVVVDYNYLEGQLASMTGSQKKKRDAIGPGLRKAKDQLENIQMTVPAHTPAASLSGLVNSPGVNIILAGSGGAPPSKRALFTAMLLMFEDVPNAALQQPVFDQNAPSKNHPNLTVEFLNKHSAPSTRVAEQAAAERFASSNIVVSTFLSSAAVEYLNEEVVKLNRCGFYRLVNHWIAKTASEEGLKNRKIKDVVYRSRLVIQKSQCTQANNFNAFHTFDYMYYGTSTRDGRALVDHYVPAAQVGAMTQVPEDTLQEHAKGAGVNWSLVLPFLTDEGPSDGVRVYVTYGNAV